MPKNWRSVFVIYLAYASTCCGGTKDGGGEVGAPASGHLPINLYSHKCVF